MTLKTELSKQTIANQKWKDLIKKARIKEKYVIIKELENNSAGAIDITQAYSIENSNLAIDINKY